MIRGWDEVELVDEVLRAPRRFTVGLPDTEVIDRPGWHQVRTPSITMGALNDVSLAVLPPHEVEPAIDRVLDDYRERGAVVRWYVGPDWRPLDFGERLARRGLARSEVWGMARAIAGAPIEVPDAVEHVAGEGEGLEALSDVMARGWSADRTIIHRLHRAQLAHPAGRVRFYLARVDGVPAGAGGYIVASERTAYLVGAVVLPEFRGRGLYRALVDARIEDARRRGLTLAVSHASATTSGPILARMGFATIARIAGFHA